MELSRRNIIFKVKRYGRNSITDVFRVAGVSFDGRQEFLKKIFESKEKLDLSFEREPDNPYDSNAIKVMINIG